MKQVLFFLIFLLPFCGFAQDYQTVRSDFVRFFADTAGDYHGIKIDSVETVGSDSIFYNYWHVRKNSSSNCSPTMISYTPSFVGHKIIDKPNGVNLLFNVSNDTIRINTLAGLNDSWNLMDMDSGTYIQGTVSQIQNQVILDSLVETKTIALLLLDSNDNVLPNEVNGAAFVISNNLGIVACPDLYYFPEQINYYTIVGMEKPNRGIFRPTCGEYYEHTIGDEYHRLSSTTANSFNSYRKSIARVSGVDNEWPLQTVYSQIVKESYSSEYPASTAFSVSYDTLVVNLSQPPTPCSGPMPKESEFLFGSPGASELWCVDLTAGFFCGRPSFTEYRDENFTYVLDTTQGPNYYNGGLTAGHDEHITSYTYGLGTTRTHRYQWYPTYTSSSALKYYKRGTEECGIPYTFDELLSESENQIAQFNLFRIVEFTLFPNPIKQGSLLNLGANYTTIEVLDFTGKLVVAKRNASTLETQSLNPGIYLVRTTAETSSAVQRLVVTK